MQAKTRISKWPEGQSKRVGLTIGPIFLIPALPMLAIAPSLAAVLDVGTGSDIRSKRFDLMALSAGTLHYWPAIPVHIPRSRPVQQLEKSIRDRDILVHLSQ